MAFDAASIAIEPARGTVALVLSDIAVRERRDRLSLAVPRCHLTVALWPLLAGKLVPRAVEAGKVAVVWRWSAERVGRKLRGLLLIEPDRTRAAGRMLREAMRIFARVATRWNAPSSLGTVERLTLPHVDLSLVEDRLGLSWRLPDSEIIYARSGRSQTLTIAGAARDADGPLGRLKLDSVLDRDGRRRMHLELAGISFSRLARALPSGAGLNGIAMPLDLTASMTAAADGRIETAELAARFGAGRLRLPPFYPQPVAVDELAFALALDEEAGRVRLESFRARFGGTDFVMTGALVLPTAGRPPSLKLSGGFDRITVASLQHYWPAAVGRGARRWITGHIAEGELTDGRLAFVLSPTAFESGVLPENAFTLDFAFNGLKVHYLGELPPLVTAEGSGHLTRRRLRLALTRGRIGDQQVGGTVITLHDIDRKHQARAEIALRTAGPLRDLLAALDRKPLGFPGRFGLDPARVNGRATARARLLIPLRRNVTLADVGFAVDGRVTDFRLAGFGVLGIPALRADSLSIAVDETGMTVTGRLMAPGLAADLKWREQFHPASGAPGSHFQLADGRIDFARAGWLKTGPLKLAGHARWNGRITGRGFALSKARFSFDLEETEVAADWVGYRKPKERKAELSFRLVAAAQDGAAAWRIVDLRYASGADLIKGMLSWHRRADGAVAIDRLALSPLRLGENDLAVSFLHQEKTPTLSITGRRLDARPMLERITRGTLPEGGKIGPLRLQAQVARIIALNKVQFAGLEATGNWDRHGLAALRLGVQDEHAHPLTVSLTHAAACNCRQLSLRARDAGRFALGFGLFENAQGGELTLTAALSPVARQQLEMTGKAVVADVTIVRRSALVSVVEKGRESGLDAFVGENGVHFDRVEIPFHLKGPRIEIDDGRARGTRLGLTFAGEVDRTSGQVAINGIMVPAYALNALLGRIPLIGGLFSGGKGGGLLAVRYTMRGDIRSPKITVNPMTLFMPGILRKPFEGGKGRLPDAVDEPARRRDGKSPPPEDGSKRPPDAPG
ncbi:MAG: hypothetical protein D6740_10730 [Alphaproteobacteria bacterium]|nr:MAG: hypothetical protein D6740_10730 [Alphaproteobacteria bacterium]